MKVKNYYLMLKEEKEEIGWDDLDFSFLALNEEFVNDKGYNNHQLNIIYKAIYKKDIDEIKFKLLEDDWINFECLGVDNLIKEIDPMNKNQNKVFNKTNINWYITTYGKLLYKKVKF